MAKGKMPKFRREIRNFAVDERNICNSLPRNYQSSDIILVKLKKEKIAFNCHVHFEPVCTQ